MSRLDEDDDGDNTERALLLMLRVALILLGEARLRGDFGEEEGLRRRAAELVEELGETARAINLSAPTGRNSSVHESLRLDGILYGGGGTIGLSLEDAVPLQPDAQAELDLLRAERAAMRKGPKRSGPGPYVRSIAAPPQPDSAEPILAVEIFADGLFVDRTCETEPQPDDVSAERSLLSHLRGSGLELEDDVGTTYVPSGEAHEGGVRARHSRQGFLPAPPPTASVLRIVKDDGTVELDLDQGGRRR